LTGRRSKKRSGRLKMAGKYIEELVARLGWDVDKKAVNDFQTQIDGAATSMRNIVGIAGTLATAAVTYFVTATNKATAMNTAIAQSAGVSAQAVEDWSRALTVIGMGSAEVSKTVQFMNKQLGGLKSGIVGAAGIGKALTAVGLSLSDLEGLSVEDQFKAVLSATQKVEDAQTAIAAGQQLLGEKSARLIGFFRTQSKSVEEILELQARMNLQTDEGRAGAMRFFGAWDLVTAAFTSLKELAAGTIGGALAPMLERLVEWIAANRELIQERLAVWADRIASALQRMVTAIQWLLGWLSRLVSGLGGLENTAKLAAVAVGAVFAAKTILNVMKFATELRKVGVAATLMNLAVAATPLLIAAVVALLFLLGEDLYHFFTGGESVLGKIGDKIAQFARQNVTPFIAGLLGMTPEEFDYALSRVWMRVERFFTKDIPGAHKFLVDAVSDGMTIFFGFFGELLPRVYDTIKSWIATVVELLSGIGKEAALIIRSTIGAAVDAIRESLGRLPIVGRLFDTGTPASATVRPSAGAQTAASAIVNNGGARSVSQSVNMAITQLPGESGEALGRRVKNLLQAEMGRAIKGLASGAEV